MYYRLNERRYKCDFKSRLNDGRDDRLLVSSSGRLFQTAGAEQLKARLPKDVLGQVGSSRLTCVDDLKDRVGCATVSSSCK